MAKNYVVIIRDHSGSMSGIARNAARDYNSNIRALKEAAKEHGQDTIASVIECGVGPMGTVRRVVTNSSVQALQEVAEADYKTDGGCTPLFDSVGEAIGSYYTARSQGATSTGAFYTDLAGVSPKTVAAKCKDISDEVLLFPVMSPGEGLGIRKFLDTFCLGGEPMLKGAAFYELTKAEKKVQDYKQLVIQDRKTGACYSGLEARNLLGIPLHGDIQLFLGNHANYTVFVQSTSVNRKLKAGTKVLYWERVGVPFTEGPSAPKGKRGKR